MSHIGLLHKCIAFNLKIGNKICRLVTLLKHSQDSFELFSGNLDLTLDSVAKKKYYLLVALCDFNTKLC